MGRITVAPRKPSPIPKSLATFSHASGLDPYWGTSAMPVIYSERPSRLTKENRFSLHIILIMLAVSDNFSELIFVTVKV